MCAAPTQCVRHGYRPFSKRKSSSSFFLSLQEEETNRQILAQVGTRETAQPTGIIYIYTIYVLRRSGWDMGTDTSSNWLGHKQRRWRQASRPLTHCRQQTMSNLLCCCWRCATAPVPFARLALCACVNYLDDYTTFDTSTIILLGLYCTSSRCFTHPTNDFSNVFFFSFFFTFVFTTLQWTMWGNSLRIKIFFSGLVHQFS